MRKRALLIGLSVVLAALPARAVLIGFFPGLDKLIEQADAIVILRIDRQVTDVGSPTLYTTYDCFIYQTLQGDVPINKRSRLQLMDTRMSFASPFAINSSHLMFLTKKRSIDEPTDYRTIEIRGANVRLPSLGHERLPEGKTVKDQIQTVLKEAVVKNQKEFEKEQAFLNQMMQGTAERLEALEKQ